MISNDVKNLIRDANFDFIEPKYVFAYGIPNRIKAKVLDKIVILVNDISLIPSTYGSDNGMTRDGTVQLQLFYPLSISGDVTTLYEEPILSMLRKNGWRVTIGGGVDRDPNTSQFYTTYHLKKKMELTQ